MKWLLRLLIRGLVKAVARVEVRGKENIPTSDTFIIATNHIGILDIIMAYYALNRWDMFILVAEKWGKIGWINWLGRQLNFIFIDRFNPDLKALREVIGRMQHGQVLVIAPEGTRSRTGALIEGKPGVSYLAAKAGFPIIPVAITGTEDKVILGNIKKLRRSSITVTGGRPFNLPPLPSKDRDQILNNYTDEIMCQIAAILPESYHGVYAKHPRLIEILSLRK
jgi:1-acyl-sn-glycerol-3-phosphate acyltransferase